MPKLIPYRYQAKAEKIIHHPMTAEITFHGIDDFFEDYDLVKGRRKDDPATLNVVASFDIETTSFYMDDSGVCLKPEQYFDLPQKEQSRFQKYATMCAWGFGLNGKVILGRTWEEFQALMDLISSHYGLGEGFTLAVYVHNLSFEFQWIRKLFQWESVFAVRDRYPIRARSIEGIEFRDSLIISGMSLDATSKNLISYPVKKLVGDWDYSKLRGTLTPISDKEWEYLVNDNLVVMSYMQGFLEEYQDINKIPMTKTGFVREDVRNACYWTSKSHKRDHDHKFIEYRRLMNSLSLDGSKEYMMLRKAFMGGFTHASSFNAGVVIRDVISRDESSAYPAVICSEMFPMGKGIQKKPKTQDELKELMRSYCCVMDITFYDVKELFIYEHIISLSKCSDLVDAQIDNGRIIHAKKLRIVITEIDFECFEQFYTWKGIRIHSMYCYHRGYLPKAIIEKTLEYYHGKTTLKDVPGKEVEYARLKTLVNAIFGMMVQDPFKNEIIYKDDEWQLEFKDMEAELEKYNESPSRFLFYAWGIYITAYARRNIMSAILECRQDYIYTDTDSVKYIHPENHERFFEKYNALVDRKIRQCLKYRGLDSELAKPKTTEGILKPLGYFEIDAEYSRFCTLGAKRYAVDYGHPKKEKEPWTQYSLTISGVSKKSAVPEIWKRMQASGKDFFDFFKFGQLFDREMCGKNLHTYIDDETEGILIDEYGIPNPFHELSSVHLEATTYEMTASDEYISLFESVQSIMYID